MTCYFYLVVDPFQPSGALRAAVDQDETVHHGRPPVSQTNQNIGPETNTEPDAVTDAEIMDHILDLQNSKHMNYKIEATKGLQIEVAEKMNRLLLGDNKNCFA